ncbi:MAG TPA: DEAD/DEAH box helicase, partial [Thermoanaerobaculia bacterium]|nr:DEAD/DEAH box helicase [Thermoanaerobaculia bacterium]
MRVDYEKREIVCAVGDLVYESTYRRIGVERGDGFRRMWIGQDIHSQRAEQRSNEDPRYRAEVHVVHRTNLGGWSVTITGRIDGLSVDKDAKRVSIEEVKSIHFDLELESLMRSEKLQRHLYQLLLYAYFLSGQPDLEGFAFEPQLVLIDLVSGEAKTIDTEFDRTRVRDTLDASLAKLIDSLETAAALRVAKRAFADTLQFPFDAMRPGQDEIVSAVARAVYQRDSLLVSAPTGIGKTMAVLYPALRQSLKLGKKLFVLTSKTLQQDAAINALRALNDGSFRVLRIRAKSKMCAHTEMICHEDFCPFAARYSDKMEKSGLLSHLVTSMSYFDPDLTFEIAREHEVCPFEVSLELIEQADVVVCDYNYIFDPYVGLKAYQQESDYGDCVLVVDEAHNLVDRGRGYYSPDLHEKQFDDIKQHLMTRNCWIEGWEELLELLRDHFHELAAQNLEDDGAAGFSPPDEMLGGLKPAAP